MTEYLREMLTDRQPTIQRFDDVVATAPRFDHVNGRAYGCLYDAHGKVIRLSQRIGGHLGDHFSTSDADILDHTDRPAQRTFSGKSIYLGHYMAHFGHFLTETISTFWIYPEFDRYDHFIFHPFIFGRELTPFAKDTFAAFGISIDRIVMIDTATHFERIDVPERLFIILRQANIALRDVYRRLAEIGTNGGRGSRIYLSRRRHSVRNGTRAIINEPFVEREMAKLGFNIIVPETLSLEQQIDCAKHATVLCGFSGSALHLALFMQPAGHLIELGDPRSNESPHLMETICTQIAQVRHSFVSFDGKRIMNSVRPRSHNIGAFVRPAKIATAIAHLVPGSPQSDCPVQTNASEAKSLITALVNSALILLRFVMHVPLVHMRRVTRLPGRAAAWARNKRGGGVRQ